MSIKVVPVNVIHIEVGGKKFTMLRDTIERHPDTLLYSLVFGKPGFAPSTGHVEIRVDMNPTIFEVILNYYYTGFMDFADVTCSRNVIDHELAAWGIPREACYNVHGTVNQARRDQVFSFVRKVRDTVDGMQANGAIFVPRTKDDRKLFVDSMDGIKYELSRLDITMSCNVASVPCYFDPATPVFLVDAGELVKTSGHKFLTDECPAEKKAEEQAFDPYALRTRGCAHDNKKKPHRTLAFCVEMAGMHAIPPSFLM